MMTEEDRAALDAAMLESRQAGLAAAASIHPDVGHVFSEKVPSAFGNRWAGSFSSIRQGLVEEHGDNASALVDLAVRYFEYARCSAAAFVADYHAAGEMLDNETVRSLCTPDGYADREGWAYTFYNGLSSIEQPEEILGKSPLTEFPTTQTMLKAIALLWFFEAARRHEDGDRRALDMLFEASEAWQLSQYEYGWEAAIECDGESLAMSRLARKGAMARHKENHDLKREALEYFHEHREQFTSKDAAAEAIAGKVVPAAFRTVRNWLKEAPKN
jgi:hypothetical protein